MGSCFTIGKITLLLIFFVAIAATTSLAQTVDCKNNCANASCNFAITVEKGCRCFDGIDNDGDGKIDASDSECATYYGLTYVGTSTNCTFPTPNGNIFATIGAPTVSGQNTSDTQSKVTVGDVDGDGIPDAVITSKWNSEIRIIATSNGQADGSSAGDVKSSFKTTGQGAKIFSGAGGCNPKNLLFEHENLIADIDKNGKAEIFGVVSNRSGNPSSPPTCFFLVAFKYVKGTLVPLYDAVQIGTDRPGPIGVADMDGDGKAEIYLRDRIYAAETGVLLATSNGNWDLDIVSGSVAVDMIKGDNGKMELVCGTKIFSIPSLASRSPASPAALTLSKDMNTITANKCFVKLMLDPVEYGTDTHSMCSVADVDRDGSIDVVISGALNDVFGKTAVFYWNIAKNASTYYIPPDIGYSDGWPWGTGRINLGDANGDGKTDLSFVAGNQLTCLTQNGSSDPAGAAGTLSLLWVRTINDSRSGVLGVTIFDFDNDGKPEMVYRDSQEVVIVDGATGATKKWSAICQSHTYTEGPVIADVNGDGATDICVTCNRSNSFDINDPIQQQALGEIRLFFTSGAAWLPTRKVWNQHGYFVVNIKDDLTLPFPQFDQSTTFSNGNCASNGLVGPQKPMNVFMNQVPYLDASGCPVFPAPDLTFFGDDPGVGTDTDGDGVYTPAVVVTPPICGNLTIQAYFNIQNKGDLAITDNIPVSFFNGDPTANPSTAVRLYNTTVSITNLLPGGTLKTPTLTFNGPGTTFDLYIVLNNDGSVIPVLLTGGNAKECTISNNLYKVKVIPSPFSATIEKISDNNSCTANPPYSGEVRAHIFIGGVETVDYSPYTFKWTNSANQTVSTAYNATALVEGTYTLVVTNTLKGCSSTPVSQVINRTNVAPTLAINILSHMTKCAPPDGKLEALVNGSNNTVGYTITWYEEGNSILTGPIASGLGNLSQPNYYFSAQKNGCIYISGSVKINTPNIPDALASETDVVDCLNSNSGTVSSIALINGSAASDQSKFTFDWYFYNNVTGTKGSLLPPANGTANRTGLAAGYYELIITDNQTLCQDQTPPVLQVKTATVLPTVSLTPGTQTSCDPLNPNGSIVATGVANGSSSNLKYEWFKGDNTIAPAIQTETISTVSTLNNALGSGQIYTVKVTTSQNCSVTGKTTIPDNKIIPNVTLTAVNNTICAPAASYTGKVTATITNQVGPLTDYTITFGPGGGTQGASPNHNVYNNLNGGVTYTVIVKHIASTCTSNLTSAGVLNVQSFPVLTTGNNGSTNCVAGKEDGKATVVTVDGFASPAAGYTYSWTGPVAPAFPVSVATNNSNTYQLIKVQGGAGYDYTAVVTNTANGCTNTAVVNVVDAKVLPTLALAAVNNTICAPAASYNGKVTATVSNQIGALTDYTFVFGGGAGNQGVSPAHNTFNNLNGGINYTTVATHTVTGCISSLASINVLNVQSFPVLTTGNNGSTNCVAGKEDGKATVVTVDGFASPAAGYTYSWTGPVAPAFPVSVATNNSNTYQLTKVQGGAGYDYTALVTNTANGCTNTAVVNVVDAKVLPTLTLAAVNNTICAPAASYNGKVTATVSNQIGALTDYTFVFGGGAGNQGVSPAHNTFNNLNGGINYTTVATHTVTGCISSLASINVLNVQSFPALTTGNNGSTNCVAGKEDGKATVVSVDGFASPAAGYTYSWTGPVAPAFPVSVATNNSNTYQLTKVQGGAGYDYTALVTNTANGCTNTAVVNVVDAKVLPTLTLAAVNNTICAPAASYNGKVTATVSNQIGALTDYTFVFGGGAGNQGVSPAHNTFNNLNGGINYTTVATHTVTGCISSLASINVLNVQSFPVLTTGNNGSTNCVAGKEDGKATVVSVDGFASPAAGYTYAWTGPVAPAFPVSVATNNSNTYQLTKVQGGAGYDYTALVTNTANGCTKTAVVNVADAKVLPTLTLAAVNNTICAPAASYDGTVTATVSNQIGALTDYTFVFGGGAGNQGVSPAHNTFNNLNGGINYTTVATHTVTGCVSSLASINVLNVQSFPVLTTGNNGSTNCVAGKEDGKATVVTVDGFASPAAGYTYAWTGPVAPAFPVSIATNNSDTYQLTKVQGGAGYDYTALVTNTANGCTKTTVVNVVDAKVLPTLTLAAVNNTICAPAASYDGKVTATVSNQIGVLTDYTFVFGGGAGNQGVSPAHNTFNNLNGGINYTTVATHTVTGCVSSLASINVLNVQSFPVLTTGNNGSTNCVAGKEDGKATVVSVDGFASPAAGYTYAWTGPVAPAFPVSIATNNSNAYQLIKVQGGAGYDYTALVTNTANGCTKTTVVNVVDAKVLPTLTLAAVNNTICAPAASYDGTVTATVSNQIGALTDYTFVFGGGAGNQGVSPAHNTFNNLNGGINYTTVATHTVTGCISSLASINVLNVQSFPVLTTGNNGSTNCVAGKEDGKATVVSVDGFASPAAGYTYSWTGPVAPAFPVSIATNNSDTYQLTKVQGGAGYDYTALVTNTTNGCTNTTIVNVVDAKVLPTLTLAAVNNTICAPAASYDGKVTATVSNQIGALTDYTFVFGGGAGNQGVSPAHNTFNNLNGGINYTTVATHTVTGCISSLASINVLNVQSFPALTTGNNGSTNCVAGKEDGKATVVSVDGFASPAAGYTYSWTGPVAPAFPVSIATNNSDTYQLTKVQGGAGYDYTTVVTNTTNGCTNTTVVNVVDAKVLPTLTLAAVNNTICAPAASYDGKVTATVSNQIGALTDYTFVFGGGAGNQGVSPAHNTFNNLNGGINYTTVATHTVTGCISSLASINVLNVQSFPVLTTGNNGSTNCVAGKEDGKATVVTVDGFASPAAGYTYAWTGPVVPAFPVSIATNNSDTYQLTKVQGGAGYDYTALVTNTTNGCTNTTVVNVVDAKVLPTLTLAAVNNTICAPAASYDGKVTATVSNQIGALTDYTFVFGGGAGNQGVSPAHNTFNNLNGGINYTTVATHTVTGCVSSLASINVLNVQSFPVLTTGNNGSTNCVAGKEDGKATVVSVDGFASPAAGYTYSWTGPVAPAFLVSPATNNSNTYQLIKVQGGAGYDYTALVTNTTNGCTNTAVVNVVDAKVLPTLTLAAVNNTICAPAASYDGKVTATVSNQIGALTDYTFVFGGGGGNQGVSPAHNTFNNLNGGINYTTVATHTVTGCISSLASINVLNVQSFPVLTTGNNGSTNCVAGKEDGKATVVSVDGFASPAAGYTYAWTGPVAPAFLVSPATNNSDTYQLTKVQGGAGYDYTAQVTNTTNGCTNTAVVNVVDVKVFPILTLTPQDNTICDPVKATLGPGTFDGQVQAAVNNIPGGSTVNDYYFDWSVGADGDGIVLLPGRDVGTYSVTALHHPTGCSSSSYSVQVLSAKQFPTIDVQQIPSQNCIGGSPDGTAFVNGVLPAGKTYDYKWYDGNAASGPVKDTDVTYQNVQGGISGASLLSYTVLVTILENGCENIATVGVSDDSKLPLLGALTHSDNTFCVGANGNAAASTLSYRGAAQASPYLGFTFNWSNGDTGFTSTTPLAKGTYSLTVTNDNDNCISNPVNVTVKDNLYIPLIDIADVDQSSCDPLNPNGQLTGTIDESSIGGPASVTGGYTLTWVDNVTSGSTTVADGHIIQLKGNQTYTITALRASTQCQNTQTVFLNETLIFPVVNVAITNMSTCSPANGSLLASVVPVAGSYTYYWYNNNDANNEAFVIANNNFSAINSGLYPSLTPQDYTIVVQDNVTKCNSSQVISTIKDISPAINIAVVNVALPTTCGATNSEMDATANGVTAGYTFNWYNGVPTNAGVPNYFTNPPVFNPVASLGTGDKLLGQPDGLYSVEVTNNATGCKKFLPNTLPFQNAHAVIKITKTNSTVCPYVTGNGSIEIEIFNPTLPPPPPGTDETSYFVSLLQGAATIVAPFHPAIPVGSFLVSNTLAPGSYTLAVQETYSGSNCFIYQDVLIGADALPPVITLASSIVSNSTCGGGSFDGQIVIHVEKDANDLTAPTFDIDMAPDPNGIFPVMAQPAGDYAASSLAPNAYIFTVTASTGCSATKTFTILDKPAVAELVATNISVFAAEYCDVTKEQSAKITINQIEIINGALDILDNYQFDWYDNGGLVAPVFSQVGDASATKGGEELSNVAPLPSTPATNGSYWVVATKIANAGALGGVGCSSAPLKVDIADHTVKPLITLSPFSNTACDGNFEGHLQVDVVTPLIYGAPDLSPGNGGTYRYDWGPVATAIATPSLGQTGVANLIPSLSDGGYTLTATNETTGCSSTLSTSILKDNPPVFTMNAVATNQDNCGAFNGLISGVQVFIDGVAGSVNDFDYVWYRTDLTTKVLDGLIIGSPTDQVLDMATYPAIGLDTYFVKAIRIPGTGPGSGCESAAIRKDILDDRVYPTISLASVSNTSCDGNFDGQITVTASTSSGPGSASNYNFVWTSDPDGAGALYSASNSPTNNTASPYSTLSTDLIGDGSYVVDVTNFATSCVSTGTIIVQKTSIPQEIVSVTPKDVDVCLPMAVNGGGTVTDVKIGAAIGQSGLFTYTWDDDPLMGSPFVIDNAALTQGGLNIGTYYVRAKRNAVASPGTPGVTGSGCTTAPMPFEVLNKRVTPTISLSQVSNTSCDGNFDGQITVTASTSSGPGSASNYNFVWTSDPDGAGALYSASNSATNNTASPYSTLSTDLIGDGSYVVDVTNFATSCVSTGTIIVQKTSITQEIVSVTPKDVDVCLPMAVNGGGTITDVKIGVAIGQSALFTYTWDDDPLMGSPFVINNPALTQGGLNIGTYYVRAKRNTVVSPGTPGVTGSGCTTAPMPFEVLNKRVTPTISLNQVSNTSCDGNFDGQITVTASTSSGPGSASNYNFVWTSDPDGAGALYSASNSATNNTASPYSTLSTDLIGDGSYVVDVTNFATSCVSTGTIIVQKTTIPQEIVSVTPKDVDVCLPMAVNGGGTVTDVKIGVAVGQSALFTYTWDDDPLMGSPFVINNPALTQGGLNIGTYYVRAKRNTVVSPGTPGVTGSGCTTAPMPFEVLNKRVTPTISLSQVSNTSCDGNFDGQITVTASTSSGPGSASNYNFVWTSDPDGAGALYSASNSATNNTASPYSTLSTDLIGDGSYVVDVTNFATSCVSTGTIIVQKTSITQEIVSVTPKDVDVCLPMAVNGGGTVTDVKIGVAIGQSALFTYTWDDDPLMGSPFVINNPALTQGGLDIGTYYVRAKRNAVVSPGTPGVTGSGCTTAPMPFEVLNKRVTPTISLSQVSNTSCDGNFDGQITVTASTSSGPGSASNYNFVWTSDPDGAGALYSASNSATNNTASPYSTLSTDLIGDGSYVVDVTNFATSCVSTGTIIVQKTTIPQEIVSVTPKDVDVCLPMAVNGGGTVTDVKIGVAIGQSALFTYTWDDDPLMGSPFVINNPALTQGGLDIGTYYVRAKRNTVVSPGTPGVTGSGCTTAPMPFEVLNKRVTPTISLSQVSNTSCDGNFDGQITVTASTSSGPGSASNYNFVWTSDPDGAGALYSASNSATNNTASPYSTLSTDLIGDGSYVVDVTNFATSCVSTGTIIVQKTSIPQEIVSVTPKDVDVCLPMAVNGGGTVTDVKIGVAIGQSGLFSYTWDDDPLMGSPFVINNPALTQGGLDIGTYYVRAKRNAVVSPATPGVTGSGCTTAPMPFEVLNKRVTPTISLSQVSNTSCDGNFDGQITVTASTSSGPGSASNYNFVWTSDPDGAGALYSASNSATNNTASPYSTLSTDLIGDGSYVVDVTNFATSCVSTGTIIVQKTSIPQEIVSVTPKDVDVCLPMAVNGGGTVTDVKIGVAIGQSALFTYTWDDDPLMGSPFVINNPALTQGGLDIGTYYVRAKRNTVVSPGTPGVTGSGCTTAPMPFEVLNKRVTPTISLSQVSNTSCDGNFDGQITVTASTSSGPGSASNYNFVWTSDPDGAGALYSASNSATNNTASPYSTLSTDLIGDGSYVVDVTNFATSCVSTGTIIVQKTSITQEIVSVTPKDVDVCLPMAVNGGGTVTDVKIGVAIGQSALFTYTWDDDPLMGSPFVINNPALTQGGLDIGTYYVRAKRNGVVSPGTPGVTGSGCTTAPMPFEVLNKRVTPTISLSQVSNTSCDGNFDGQITVTASTSSGPGSASNYNFVWTSDPDGAGALYSASNSATNNTASPYSTLSTDLIGDGSYVVDVTNFATSCVSTGTIIVQKTTIPQEIVSVTPKDVDVCLPMAVNGGGTVTDVKIGVAIGQSALFTYTWDDDPLMGSPFVINNPALTQGGLDIGTYYVRAKRNTVVSPGTPGVTGSGCTTAPMPFEVLNKRVTPTISLSQVSNTSCDGNFDGQITVTASTSSGPGSASNYNFVWTSDPDGAGALYSASNSATNNTASPYSTLSTDLIGDGSYVVDVTNFATSCVSTGTIIVQKTSIPQEIVSVTPKDVDVCLPMAVNGGGTVTDVKIGVAIGQSGLFSYTWDDDPLMGSPFVINNPALTQGGLDIGTYYVRAKRNAVVSPATPGVTGSGCTTAPMPFEVLNKRVTPTISLSQVSNTSCDGNFDGQITVTASTSSGPGSASNYNFVWTSDPDGAGALYSASNSATNNTASPYSTLSTDLIGDGSYVVDVTNFATSCVSTGTIIVQKTSIPQEIVSVTPKDVDVCLPMAVNGGGTVTDVKIGVAIGQSGLFSYTWDDDPLMGSPFVINNPALTQGGLNIGTYYVRAKRNTVVSPGTPGVTGSGCTTAPMPFEVANDRQYPNSTFNSIPNSVCPGAPAGNGVITSTTSENDGTVGTYSYTWVVNGATLIPTTAILNNASDGLYTITVANTATSCSSTFNYKLIIDQSISTPNIVTVSPNNPLDCNPTGGATVTRISIGNTTTYNDPPDDLDTPFDYAWYASVYPTGLIGGAANQNHQLTNRKGGKYYVLVKDLVTNCVSTPVEFVIDYRNIISPKLELTQTKKQINCLPKISQNIGSAELLATVVSDDNRQAGPTYTYTWFKNLNFAIPKYSETLNSPLTTDVISKLVPSNYSIIALNELTGCSDSVIYIVPDESPLFTPVLTLSPEPVLNCLVPDGSIYVRDITVYGINYPFPSLNFQSDYYVGQNPNTAAAGQPMTPVLATSWIKTGLIDGLLYTAKVTDNNTGCFNLTDGIIPNGRLFPTVNITVDNPLINCDKTKPNGQLSATADGVVGGYTFQWYAGASSAGALLPKSGNKLIGVGFLESPTLTFTAKATNDITGCSGEKSGQVTDGRVNPPTPTALVMRDRTNCPSPNGWVTANVAGKTFNYTFNWYNGSSVQGSPNFTGIDYLNRDTLFYTVTATDQITGCVSPGETVKVNDLRKFPQLLLSSEPSYCEATNRGGTGSVSVSVLNSMEVTLDEITWYDDNTNSQVGIGAELYDLYPGNYRVDVVSSEGCDGTGTVEIVTEVLSYNLVSANNDGKNDGWIIDCIEIFPNNNVKIFNRSGVLVYEATGYDNGEVMFKGIGERGIYLSGKALPDGTYFFIIDKHNGTKPIVGYIELVR